MAEHPAATELGDIVAFADRMHFPNASVAKAEYVALLAVADAARAVSKLVGPDGPPDRRHVVAQLDVTLEALDAAS